MGKITAIISAYYCADFLKGRIDNLLEQDCQIVAVCQQGSKEETIIKSYGDAVRMLMTFDIPTIYTAWNVALTVATGDYIISANSDDRFYPGALQKMAEALDNDKRFAMVYSDIDMCKEIDGPIVHTYKNIRGDFKLLLKQCFLGPFPMWRKSLHDKYGLFDAEYKVAGDYEFWLRIASKGERFYYIEETLGIYCDRPDSAEHREKVRTVWETARAKRPYRSKK